MKKPKLNLANLSVPAKIILARTIVEEMTTNVATFPSPNPPLSEISSKAQELEDAYQAAQDGGESATVAMKAREKELDRMLTREASYVSNIADGDEEIINLAGMEAGAAAGAPQLPARPENLKLKDANASGSIKADWKSDKNTKANLVYIAVESSGGGGPANPMPPAPPAPGAGTTGNPSAMPTPPEQPGTTGYSLYDVCTSSKIIISGLQPARKIWIVVLAIGAAGKSDFSDPATIIVR